MSEEKVVLTITGLEEIKGDNPSYGDYLKFLLEQGVITVAEARATIGLKSGEADDVSFYHFKKQDIASRPYRSVTAQKDRI